MPRESESHALALLDQLVAAVAKIDAAVAVLQAELRAVLEASSANTKALRGTDTTEGALTRLSHVERTCKDLGKILERELAAIRADMATRRAAGEDVTRTRWRAIAELGVAITAVVSLILQLI